MYKKLVCLVMMNLLCLFLFHSALIAKGDHAPNTESGSNYYDSGDQIIRAYGRFSDTNPDLPMITNLYLPSLYIQPAMTAFIENHLFKLSFEGGFFLWENTVNTENYEHGNFDIDIFAGIKESDAGMAIELYMNNEFITYDTATGDIKRDLINTGINIPFSANFGNVAAMGFLFGVNYIGEWGSEHDGYLGLSGGIDFAINFMDFLHVGTGIFLYGYYDFEKEELDDVFYVKWPITAGLNLMDIVTLSFEYNLYDFELISNSLDEAKQVGDETHILTHKFSGGIEVWIGDFAPRFKFTFYNFEGYLDYNFRVVQDNIQLNVIPAFNQYELEFGFVWDMGFTIFDVYATFIPKTVVANDFAMKLGAGFEF